MRGTALIYGLAAGIIVMVLQFLHYLDFVRSLPTQVYIIAIAVLFGALGIFAGYRLTPRPPAADFRRNEKAAASLGLTAREIDVLDRLATGASNKEIARKLGVSPHTVKTHIAHVYDKLGVHGRGKAVDMARRLSLLP
ncbi:helix-turn-helix transcriptional regulator [Paraurantiacibacter namhicola]|uniref:CsgBAC operon transcriptional regulatory protein n=1 Tax=Paraurantiacibacter namhicola TaxID=645517 RepID=A0A1C7DA11_9SPHN|nr:helix-turn-helix transcriptional regulator [Paraurantiacibacter namhicola]ANU08288.1 CsgBAC operon transcriptional regulatory protein [Paraurantiacibacter namhicola]